MSTARSGEGARGSRWRLLPWLLALWMVLLFPLHAQADLEEQIRAVAAELRCPVCQNLSVADSPSEMAREMRGVIREQLQAGRSPEEIKAYFLSRYGDWILLSPRPRGLNLVVWIGPFAAALAGLAVALLAARRWARRPRARGPAAVDPALTERVRREAFAEGARDGALNPERLSPLELERESLYAALREFEFDSRSGKLSTADYAAMREEYEARAAAVLAELDQRTLAPAEGAEGPAVPRPASRGEAGETVPSRRSWRLAAAGTFLLVFGIALGYFLTQSLRQRMGEQDTLTGDFLTGTGPGGIMPGSRGPAANLERLLASGRAAYERQDWRAAIDAFREALTLDPANPEALTSLGLVLLQGGHADDALVAIDRALAKSPNYPFALWAKGLVLFEARQDYAGAIKAWETLMSQNLAPADTDEVARMLTEARKRLAAQSARPSRVATAGATITGTVTLAPSVRAELPPGAALFVIARRGDGPPLAVKRIPDPAFPAAFSLAPEDRMVRDVPFEGEVTLVARLKRDGKAGTPAPGDLEGRAPGPVKVGRRGVEIVLDRAH